MIESLLVVLQVLVILICVLYASLFFLLHKSGEKTHTPDKWYEIVALAPALCLFWVVDKLWP